MSIISDDSPIINMTKELCQQIVDNSDYKSLMETVEVFLNNDEARLLYQNVADRSDELRGKQQAGVQLGDNEIEGFKELRNQMEKNPVIMEFLGAQDDLQMIQKSVSQYVGMSLELGRVPTDEDIAELSGGGCCGGGCGEDGGSCGT